MKKLFSLAILLAVTLLSAAPAMAAGFPARVSLGLGNNGTLQPNQEYRIPILARYEDEPPAQLREEDLGGRRFAVSLREGTEALYLPTVETDRGLCWLVVRTRPSYTTDTAAAQVLLRLLEKDSPREVSRTEARLTVASEQMSDRTVAAMKAGDDLTVENTAPVITGRQFQQIGALNDYGDVTLVGKGWEYTVAVGELESRNLYSTTAARPEYAAAYPDQQFAFLSFPGAPDFGAAGTMIIDVSETPEEFEGQFYLYRLLDDRLYYLRTDYDSEAATLTFHPSQLGDYVITNRPLTDPAEAARRADAPAAVETAASADALKASPAAVPRTAAPGSSSSGSDASGSSTSGSSASGSSTSGSGASGSSTLGSSTSGSSASGSGTLGSGASGSGSSAGSSGSAAAQENPSTGSQRTGTAAVLGLSALAIAALITMRKQP